MKYRNAKNIKKTMNETKETNGDINNMSEKTNMDEIAKEQKVADNETKLADAEQSKEEVAEKMAEELDTSITKEQELEDKLAECNDKYVRLAAEFDNYRRRGAKERLELIGTASEDVIKGLLPILDDCERALEVIKKSNDTEAAKEGTELILNKLFTFLKSKGLEMINAKEKELDTDFHEAVAQFPIDDKTKKNKIIDVVQKGYTLNGKVIRFAKVVVGI
ncbi:MAG: nucleotide exchange factor GrpE [Bacteroidales bacterium]